MNFYPRFPGDYAKKTARLSLAEHGAYTLLLDEVYSTEEALPADADELCRICRALTKEERELCASARAPASTVIRRRGPAWIRRMV